jgi:hypothetical protein
VDSTFEPHLNSLTLWITTFKDEKLFCDEKSTQKHVGIEKRHRSEKGLKPRLFFKDNFNMMNVTFHVF